MNFARVSASSWINLLGKNAFDQDQLGPSDMADQRRFDWRSTVGRRTLSPERE